MTEEYKRISGCSIKWILFLGVLGVGLLCFFIVVHPLYIYDTDDWTYISYFRNAWPMKDAWNPTKILPETLMPLMAEMGLRFIMPLTNDYIGSMAIAFAIIVVLFILFYIYQMGRTLKKLFSIKTGVIFGILIIFLLFHFLAFSVNIEGNVHMFYGGSVNCTFNYLIPGLINATMVMYMLQLQKEELTEKNPMYIGGMVLIIYLCLNSNMFHSILLASFSAVSLLFNIISRLSQKRKGCIKSLVNRRFIKDNILWIGIDAVWVITLLFEMQGKRAEQATTKLLELPIKETFLGFVRYFGTLNKIYIKSMEVFIIISIGICIWYVYKKKCPIEGYEKNYLISISKIITSLIITCIYQILLCAKVSPSYISNNLVSFTWLFWIMLLAFISFTYMVARVPKVIVCLPLMIYILIFETVIDGKTYAENNVAGLKGEVVKALDENIINQVIQAEEKGLSEVEVYVPVHNSTEWPIAISYGGVRIANTLYRHGIIGRTISITLVPDSAINEKFGVN